MEPANGAVPYVKTPPSRAVRSMPWLDAAGNVICSTRLRSPGSFSWDSVAALPAARQPTDLTQLIEARKLSGDTFGLGSIDQDEPFQFSMKLCGWNPAPPPPPNDPNEPTAQHCTEVTQETSLKIPGVEESGTEAETSFQLDAVPVLQQESRRPCRSCRRSSPPSPSSPRRRRR